MLLFCDKVSNRNSQLQRGQQPVDVHGIAQARRCLRQAQGIRKSTDKIYHMYITSEWQLELT